MVQNSMFKTKYRIVQRFDRLISKDYFYIEKKDFPWSSWTSAYTEGYTKRFGSLKSAMDELDTFLNAVYHESF
jgi:hypothetical protein